MSSFSEITLINPVVLLVERERGGKREEKREKSFSSSIF